MLHKCPRCHKVKLKIIHDDSIVKCKECGYEDVLDTVLEEEILESDKELTDDEIEQAEEDEEEFDD